MIIPIVAVAKGSIPPPLFAGFIFFITVTGLLISVSFVMASSIHNMSTHLIESWNRMDGLRYDVLRELKSLRPFGVRAAFWFVFRRDTPLTVFRYIIVFDVSIHFILLDM
jgi:hypothetical protein